MNVSSSLDEVDEGYVYSLTSVFDNNCKINFINYETNYLPY